MRESYQYGGFRLSFLNDWRTIRYDWRIGSCRKYLMPALAFLRLASAKVKMFVLSR